MSNTVLTRMPFLNPNGTVTMPWLLYLLGLDVLGEDNSPTFDQGGIISLLDQVRQELETLPAQQVYTDLIGRISALEEQPIAQPGKDSGMIIKAIQRGVITLNGGVASATATITSVDTTKTELRYLGCKADTNDVRELPDIVLTNSTTITATRSTTATGTEVSWELTEWQ